MDKDLKIRTSLLRYQDKKKRYLDVFHLSVSDNISGLGILAGLLENKENLIPSQITYQKPETSNNELVGVTRTYFDPVLDVIFLGVLSLELNFHVICNDSFAARDLMIRILFGSRTTFNRQIDGLLLHEEWTAAPRFVLPFLATLDELIPFCERPTGAPL